jgi:hypothetical protein
MVKEFIYMIYYYIAEQKAKLILLKLFVKSKLRMKLMALAIKGYIFFDI